MFSKLNKISPANNTSVITPSSVITDKFNFDDIYDIDIYKQQIKEKDNYIEKLEKENEQLIILIKSFTL
tara:strand:+ start:562 stop:768 length:207 start_codon:yes stop_codon:yes gene_type:complete